MQILHAGRYAYNDKAVAPSPVKAPISPFTPKELDEEGIENKFQISPNLHFWQNVQDMMV